VRKQWADSGISCVELNSNDARPSLIHTPGGDFDSGSDTCGLFVPKPTHEVAYHHSYSV